MVQTNESHALEQLASRLVELSGPVPALHHPCASAAAAVHDAAAMRRAGDLTDVEAQRILCDLEVVLGVVEVASYDRGVTGALSVIGTLLATCCRAGAVATGPPDPIRRGPSLISLTTCYAEDSKQDRLHSVVLLGVAILLLLAASTLGILAATRWMGDGTAYAPFLIAFTPLAAGSLIAAWHAERLRRSSAESRRLQRQLSALDPYLEPFTEPARSLIRASLAPRLFGRLLEDADPLRDVRVPMKELADALGLSDSKN
jgi:hypothetical protein